MARNNYKKKQSIPAEAVQAEEVVAVEPIVEVAAEPKDVPEAVITIESKPELEIKPVIEPEVENKPLYTVHVTHPSLRRRSAPKIAQNMLGLITDMGNYAVYEEREGWGRLEDGSWIMLQYTERCNES